jgi:hypothetical protein
MTFRTIKKSFFLLAILFAFQSANTAFAASALWYNGWDSYHRNCTQLKKATYYDCSGDSGCVIAWSGGYEGVSYPSSFPSNYVLYSQSAYSTGSGDSGGGCMQQPVTGGATYALSFTNRFTGAQADGGAVSPYDTCGQAAAIDSACSPRILDYGFNQFSPTNADATFMADTNVNLVQPGGAVYVRLAAANGQQGGFYNGWFQGGLLNGPVHGLLCFLLGCSAPPAVAITAYAPSGSVFNSYQSSISFSASGVLDASGTLTAPSTPGNYVITVVGCNEDPSRTYQGCQTIFLPFTVGGPIVDVHFVP